MKITKVEVFPLTFKYRPGFEFKVSYGVLDSMMNVIIKLHTDDGLIGYGEAAPPPPPFLPKPQEGAMSFLGKVSQVILGEDPFDIRGIHAKMDAVPCDDFPDYVVGDFRVPGEAFSCFVKGGIDFALYDLMGKATGQPVYKLLGGTYTGPQAMHYSLSIQSPEEMAEEARGCVEEGYRTLEVKLGRFKGELSVDKEIARIEAIRKAVGPETVLVVDANIGWTPDEAVRVMKGIEPLDVYAEQPLPDLKGLSQIRQTVSSPVVADESAGSLEEVTQLIREDAADMINLKILRVGGLFKAMQIMETAEAFGLGYRHDNAIHSRFSATACLHFAIAYSSGLPDAGGTQFTRTQEDLLGDQGLVMERGHARLADPEAPGIGATPNEALLGAPVSYA